MGGSRERRLERRLTERVAAILASNPPTRKPVDIWLTLATGAASLAFVFLPKTKPTISIALACILVLLAHPLWNFWWIEHKASRRAVAVGIFLTLLLWLGHHLWPNPFFLWLETNGTTVDEHQNTKGLIVSFVVRDAAPLHSGSILPSVPLHQLRLTLSTPILRTDAEGWNECSLVGISPIPIWSNHDSTLGALGVLDLARPATLLHVTASDDNGDWDIIAVLVLSNGKLESREVLNGRLFADNSQIHIDEASKNFPAGDRQIPLTWDRQLFAHYGVPSVIGSQVKTACPALHR